MTVRVDTLRNRLAATIGLLELVGQEVGDLHVLAYDRRVAAEEAKVAGGSRDYALDTHGDLRARDAYRGLGDAVVEVCDRLDLAARYAVKVLRADDDRDRKRGPRQVAALDLAEKIAAQARRIADGSYVPVRRLPQPEANAAWAKLLKSKEQAEAETRRLQREVDRLGAELARVRGEDRRRRAG